MTSKPKPNLIIACGALAREILALLNQFGYSGERDSPIELQCLPAEYHNRPERIAPRLAEKLAKLRTDYQQIWIGYADCGSGGAIDKLINDYGIERLAGPHCYAFFEGQAEFITRADADPFCFYLTDFLVQSFEALIIKGLGLDRFPELRDSYFQHYQKLVYLAQTEDETLTQQARQAAARLGLAFERKFTGYGELGSFIHKAVAHHHNDGYHQP